MPLRLDTERLTLTPETAEDAEWLARLFSARGHGEVTTEEAGERISTMNTTMEALGIGVLVLRVKPDLDPIGYCGLIIGRASFDEPELVYELLPRAHGQGYATEAADAVLHAAVATGRHRIWATVRTWNLASLRVLEKLGFRNDHNTTEDGREVAWLVCDPNRGE